ncbi:MAG TPA: hypothetical protein VES02_17885 [Dermatophilaceae bacterium]|nr:hypothetical protein [Dermatophilaceae bacterium]
MKQFAQTARLVRLVVTGVAMSLLTAASAAARPLAPDSGGGPGLPPPAPAAVGSPLWQFVLVALASAGVVLAAVALAPKVVASRPRSARTSPSVAQPRGA